MTNQIDDLDDDNEDTLDDYEAGFIDGVLAALQIEDPTEEQYGRAFELLEQFILKNQDQDQGNGKPS